jgi:MFS family permease
MMQTMAETPDTMTLTERRDGAALAVVFSLRMLGLFLILPVFALHAATLPGGDNLMLVGLALGAYGLTQAICQIPFGMASDVFGRKPVIVFGLLLFAAGSVVAALADSLVWVLVGRIIQGAGAISAAVTALAADLTREAHRTKVMAMIGSSIGLTFALSLVAAPALYAGVGMSGIFALTAVLALGGIAVVMHGVSPAPTGVSGTRVPLSEVLRDTALLRLNFGIFTLHMVQMAMFVVLPALLVKNGGIAVAQHWQVYLPAVLFSFALMVPAIVLAERRDQVKPMFIAAIGLLLVTELVLAFGSHSFAVVVIGLISFFVAFNILEASLPSLISRVAPPRAKGSALGVHNTCQALGLFAGGVLGGFLASSSGAVGVFLACTLVVAIWLVLAAGMPALQRRNPSVVSPPSGILNGET